MASFQARTASGVERLAGAYRVADRRQVVGRQVHLDEGAEHRRRRAHRRDAVFGEQPQMGVGVEARGRIVEHHGRAELPLAEQLAPGRLGPTGVAHRPVQVVLVKVVPVAGGQRVGDGVAVVPRHQLREGRGAGGEIGQHRLVAAGRLDRAAVEPVARRRAGGLAMDPVAVRHPDHDNPLQRRALVAHRLDLRDMVGGDDGKARPRPVDAVFDILGLQQVGAGHGDDAQLDAADHGLVPGRNPRDHHEGEVALGRADAAQHVREAVRGRREVGKTVARLLARIGINVDEGGLVPLRGPAVDQVEPEIVEFRRWQPDAVGKRGRVIGQFDIAGHGGSGRLGEDSRFWWPAARTESSRDGVRQCLGRAAEINLLVVTVESAVIILPPLQRIPLRNPDTGESGGGNGPAADGRRMGDGWGFRNVMKCHVPSRFVAAGLSPFTAGRLGQTILYTMFFFTRPSVRSRTAGPDSANRARRRRILFI